MKLSFLSLRKFKRFYEQAVVRFSSSAVTPETVILAYRLLLDRDPENQAVIDQLVAEMPNLAALRTHLLHLPEFKTRTPEAFSPALTGLEPPMQIQPPHDEAELAELLQHVQEVWERFGETEPYWSVLTGEDYTSRNIEASRERFYQSGQYDVEIFMKALARNGLDPAAFPTCMDFGCGLGRITCWLAPRFETVYGVDISQPHLDLARQHADQLGLANVRWQRAARLEDLPGLPAVDLIYSMLVLQHNPPPVIALLLRHLLQALRPGGVAYVQIPTYREGYDFSPRYYLTVHTALQRATQKMELHYLPQAEIFAIIHETGCRLLEVTENGLIGARFGQVSNTFVVRKAGG